MNGVFIVPGLILAIISAPASAQGASRLDKAAAAVAKELLKGPGMTGTAAVVPFKSPDGGISALGGMLADSLTARLIKSGKVTALDRRYLGRVLGEIKLQLSGVTEQSDSVELGKFTGAKFLLLGNFEPLVKNRLMINARLVETGTGRVAAAARAELKLDEELRALYGRVSAADTRAEEFYETRGAGQARAEEQGLKVELILSQESFTAGQAARAVVAVSSAASVYLYSVDAQGRALLLFPAPGESPVVEAGRPLFFPGEEREKKGIVLEAALPPGASASLETLRAFAVPPGPGDPLEGAESYAGIVARLKASGLAWAEASRAFSVHR
jgi:TolB-like protein